MWVAALTDHAVIRCSTQTYHHLSHEQQAFNTQLSSYTYFPYDRVQSWPGCQYKQLSSLFTVICNKSRTVVHTHLHRARHVLWRLMWKDQSDCRTLVLVLTSDCNWATLHYTVVYSGSVTVDSGSEEETSSKLKLLNKLFYDLGIDYTPNEQRSVSLCERVQPRSPRTPWSSNVISRASGLPLA